MKKRAYALLVLIGTLATLPLIINASGGWAALSKGGGLRDAVDAQPQPTDDTSAQTVLGGQATFMVELMDAPLATVYAEAQASGEARAANATQAQLAVIEETQAAVAAQIMELDASAVELFRVQRAYNGIAITLSAANVDAIAALPGVKAVHAMKPHTLDHTTSVPLLGAPEVWDSLSYDLTGDGITIGIIDTGIDYHHTHFGGPGGGYEMNDTTVITDGLDAYFGPSAIKVKGGYDFVGDDYDAGGSGSQLIPEPDPDPLDCNGHGSHVAGTAAGFGVNGNGSTYTGGYDNVPFSTMRIGPGMAPEADLYALRVFGCEGSTNVTVEAIDWAMDPNGDGNLNDHLDIINMSLGSDSGGVDDPSVVASENAVEAGVIVVAAAGNDGNTFYIVGSPSTSGQTISVAGSVDAGSILDGFEVTTGALTGVHPALKGVAFDWDTWSGETIGDLTYPASQSTGCAPFNVANTNLISGTIVLLNWTEGECGSATRGDNLEAAGAIGMLLADDSDVFDLSIFGSDLMPSYSIPLEVGQALSDTLGTEGNITIRFSEEYDNSITYLTPQFVDTVYTSSSRGPRRVDNALKPDLTAVAVSVFSAATGTGDEGASFNGTSMATPHVAGMMALLRQQHPNWSVEELKALAMNTATYDVFTGTFRDGDKQGLGRNGAGRISAPNSAATSVVAYNATDTGMVSVSFGAIEVPVDGGTVTAEKSIMVANKGTSPATYAVIYEPRLEQEGVSYSVSQNTVTLAAGASQMITVTMTANPAAMDRPIPDPTSQAFDLSGLYPGIGEAAGYVMLVPTTGHFTAELSGSNEVPTNTSTITASATLTYTLNGTFEYRIEFSDPITVNNTGVHIHQAPEGDNGGIVINIIAPGSGNQSFGPGNPLVGTTTDVMTDTAQIQQLYTRGMYVNVHTDAFPGGEIRGQLVAENTHIRVPVHAVPRVASNMAAEPSSTSLASASTITLTGSGIDTPDHVSLATMFELGAVSPQTADAKYAGSDIQYVGAVSDIDYSGTITDSVVFFGVSTYGNWTMPSYLYDSWFMVYIDVDNSGVAEDGSGAEYLLRTTTLGCYPTYGPCDDLFITQLIDLQASLTTIEDILNYVPYGFLDTYYYNNSVAALPLYVSDLELPDGNTVINYRVTSWHADSITPDGQFYQAVDVTDEATYDLANPGIIFDGGADMLVDGFGMLDLPGVEVDMTVDPAAFVNNGSLGVLVLHHHNAEGARADAINIFTPMYMPIIRNKR